MSSTPIFKNIFGSEWSNLPPVFQKHYANRPFTNDITTVQGTLDVMCAGPIKTFAWFFWLMRGIPPYNEKNVPVTVVFKSDVHSSFFHFEREFHFNTRNTYHFKSRMIQTNGSEVVEVMQSRLGWRMNYAWENERIKLKHNGYVLYVFGRFISIPLTFLIGEGYAEEIAVDDDTFDMVVTITHSWWGKVFEYRGRFTVSEHT